MKKMILFSRVAVINPVQERYVGSIDRLENGAYLPGGHTPPNHFDPTSTRDIDCPCLVFRLANVGKSQLCNTQLRVVLLRQRNPSKENEEKKHSKWTVSRPRSNPVCPIDVGSSESSPLMTIDESFEMFELGFELNKQLGRTRGLNFSAPLLALPWTVVHPMDRHSPLYHATLDDLVDSKAEIIVVLEGVNESVSDTFQARFSYVASEIIWNAQFVPIVRQSDKQFEIDYSRFHTFVPVFRKDPIDQQNENLTTSNEKKDLVQNRNMYSDNIFRELAPPPNEPPRPPFYDRSDSFL